MIGGFAEAIIAGIVVASLVVLFKAILDYLATNKIINFLQSSGDNKNYRYRSIEVISSETDIPEDRVRRLCARSRKIKKSARGQESWRSIRK